MDSSSNSSDESAEGNQAKSRPKSAKSMKIKIKVKRHRSLSKTSLCSSSPSHTSLTDDEQVVKKYYRVKSQEQPHKQKIKIKRRRTPSGISIKSTGERTQAETIGSERHQEEKEPADKDKPVVDGATSPKPEGVSHEEQEQAKCGATSTSPASGLTDRSAIPNSQSQIDRANHRTTADGLMDKFGFLFAVFLMAVIGIALTAFMRA